MIQKEALRVSGRCSFWKGHTKAEGRFVTVDGEEKEVCAEHFVVLQQSELLAEFRRKKLEEINPNVTGN